VSSLTKPSMRLRRQRGLSIIELMVGVAIGMFIIGGAIKLFVDMFGNNRRLLIETRVNQDLRATADIIARDLRRAGYWRGAANAINVAPGTVPLANPYSAYGAASTTSSSVEFAYDRDGNNAVDGNEQGGYSVSNNTIYTAFGGASQPLSDPATVRITRFEVVNAASSVQWFDLAQHCPCVAIAASGSSGGCTVAQILAYPEGHASRPQIGMRWVDIVIEGESPALPAVRRSVVESVRLRNGQTRGACPA
jgi:prepilin peptidase dependent protein B